MEERYPGITRVRPEQGRADALGQHQADGAADERASHVRDRRLAQQPFEDHREQGEAEAEEQVGDERRPEWPEQERRVHDRRCEQQAGKDEPGHDA